MDIDRSEGAILGKNKGVTLDTFKGFLDLRLVSPFPMFLGAVDAFRRLRVFGYDAVAELRRVIDGYSEEITIRQDEKTVKYRKPAYHAVQALAAVFDDGVERITRYPYRVAFDKSLSLFGYEKKGAAGQVVTVWLDGEVPSDETTKTAIDFTFYDGEFGEPVFVDLRTGTVRSIPDQNWSRSGSVYQFQAVPCYDSPVLIADREAIPLRQDGDDK